VAGYSNLSCDLPRYLFHSFPETVLGSASRGFTVVLTNGMPVVNLPDSFGRLQDGDLLRVVLVPLRILVRLAICR